MYIVQQYCSIQIIFKAEVNVVMHNIDLLNSPSEWVDIMEKCLSAILNEDGQHWLVQQAPLIESIPITEKYLSFCA